MPAGAAHQPCASSASKSSRRESLPLSVSATQLALPSSTQPSCASLSSPFFSPRSLSDFHHCSLCSHVRHGDVWRSIYICKTPFSSLNASSQSHGVCEMVVERSTMTVISTSASANAWQTSSDLPRPHRRLPARRSVGVQEICRVASTVHHQRYVDAEVRDGPTATQRDRATAITVEVEASLSSAAECR